MANPLAKLKKSPEDEEDSPPGAPPYASGPLAVQTPKPTPEPAGDDKRRKY